MKTVTKAFAVLLSPFLFLLVYPIDKPLWKVYKNNGYNVPGYWKFFWDRTIIMKEVHYTKNNG